MKSILFWREKSAPEATSTVSETPVEIKQSPTPFWKKSNMAGKDKKEKKHVSFATNLKILRDEFPTVETEDSVDAASHKGTYHEFRASRNPLDPLGGIVSAAHLQQRKAAIPPKLEVINENASEEATQGSDCSDAASDEPAHEGFISQWPIQNFYVSPKASKHWDMDSTAGTAGSDDMQVRFRQEDMATHDMRVGSPPVLTPLGFFLPTLYPAPVYSAPVYTAPFYPDAPWTWSTVNDYPPVQHPAIATQQSGHLGSQQMREHNIQHGGLHISHTEGQRGCYLGSDHGTCIGSQPATKLCSKRRAKVCSKRTSQLGTQLDATTHSHQSSKVCSKHGSHHGNQTNGHFGSPMGNRLGSELGGHHTKKVCSKRSGRYGSVHSSSHGSSHSSAYSSTHSSSYSSQTKSSRLHRKRACSTLRRDAAYIDRTTMTVQHAPGCPHYRDYIHEELWVGCQPR